MNWLRNISIKRKLMVITMLTTGTSLVLTCILLVAYEGRAFKRLMVRDLTAQAKILAGLSTAALSFDEPEAAWEMLRGLSHEPYVAAAGIYRNGTVFAQYVRPGGRAVLPATEPTTEGAIFERDRLELRKKILLKDEVIGTVVLQSDKTELYTRLWQYLSILLEVFCASAFIAFLLSSRLQRVISQPILELSATSEAVASNKNYAVRAQRMGRDELGQLTDAFNQMLAQIQMQDDALSLSQHKLEALVHSIEGIVWECVPASFRFTFVSRQSERLLGYAPDQWLATPAFWQDHLHPEDAARAVKTRREAVARRQSYSHEYRMTAADGRVVWLHESGVVMVEHEQPAAVRGILLDITGQKQAAEQLDRLNRTLVETSRQAGMAELAVGVLHNVGNVLNSVNVSANLISERLRNSRTDALGKLSLLLDEHRADLGAFFAADPKGKLVPGFLSELARLLGQEKADLMGEVRSLSKNVEHIKEIVAMQQSYAKVGGVIEDLPAAHLVEDALNIKEGSLLRHGVTIKRELEEAPLVRVDKHKVLQILVNLLSNADYALKAAGKTDKILTVAVGRNGGGFVKVTVRDNGIRIAPENLTRIFAHGFTTKPRGHGFGLHSSALAAKEMGGSLHAFSEGPGRGATFTLELPIAPQRGCLEGISGGPAAGRGG